MPAARPREERTHITPGMLAEARGLRHHTILAWIASGELEAVDHRAPGSNRPAWKISLAAIDSFDRRRSNTRPAPRAKRRTIPQIEQYV